MLNKVRHELFEKIRKYQNQVQVDAKGLGDNINIINDNGNFIVYRNGTKLEHKQITIKGDLCNNIKKLKQMIEADYKEGDKSLVLYIIKEVEHAAIDPSKKERMKNNLRWILEKATKIAPICTFITNMLIHYKLI